MFPIDLHMFTFGDNLSWKTLKCRRKGPDERLDGNWWFIIQPSVVSLRLDLRPLLLLLLPHPPHHLLPPSLPFPKMPSHNLFQCYS